MVDLNRARDLAAQLVEALVDSPPSSAPGGGDTYTGLSTPDQVDRALSAAKPGDLLLLDPSLVYPAPLVLTRSIALMPAGLPWGRVPVDLPLPRFLGGITWETDGVVLQGLEVKHGDPSTDIIVATGAAWLIDRCRILGDPKAGAKRGIQAEPRGNCRISDSIIDDCFQPSPGMDAQAIAMWNGTGLAISGCFLRAGSETVLLGGNDSRSVEAMASDVTIKQCVLTARPEWQGQAIGVKTRLELKACRRVVIEDNDIENVWRQGQVGYLLTLNVRNQDGRAPWSTIEDVTIGDNRFRHGCSAISILGVDTDYPSGRMARVTIDANEFLDLDAAKYEGGSDKLIQIINGSVDMTISDNHFEQAHTSDLIYFDGTKNNNLRVTGNTFPKGSDYGVFGTRGTPGPVNGPGTPDNAWAQFVDGGELSGNIEA